MQGGRKIGDAEPKNSTLPLPLPLPVPEGGSGVFPHTPQPIKY